MRLFLICILLLISFTGFGQTQYSIKNKSAIKAYEGAQSLLELNEFDAAQKVLSDALKSENAFLEAYHLLGDIFRIKQDYLKAKENYRKAFSINPDFAPERYFYLADVELKSGDYQEAIVHFNLFKTKATPKPDRLSLADKYLNDCNFALNAIKNPVSFHPLNISPQINTEHHEYMASLSTDGETLIFTRQINNNEDFYKSVKKNNEWQPAEYLSANINTPNYNEGAQCISPDGRFLFFTGCNRPDGMGRCDIYVSEKEGDNWSKPINLGSPINTGGWESQPSLSADGRTLYFVSDRPGGLGSYDIWMSTLDENARWQKPVNLGSTINTPFDEQSPFIHPDNETLYFSSNGWPGMGNKDLFISRRDSLGNWSLPENLGYPINTYGEESGLSINSEGTKAFFSSNNYKGNGGFDIYSFDLPQKIKPKAVNYVKGKVFDAISKKPLNALVEIVELSTANSLYGAYADRIDGTFLAVLPNNRKFGLNVFEDGYLFYTENFSTERYPDGQPISLDIPLNKIAVGNKVILKNIFFDTNKYDIKDDSKAELAVLIDFLNDNKGIIIEIQGHTDNIGDDKANLLLSENRAKSVQRYLIEAGIDAKRLKSRGFGENSPIDINDTIKGRANNRRTEFLIIGI
ncbi:OmpA family protein [Pseudopedobacter sp.]|uniref:OmpA family protein n=1 Tax=Pseudopedobacter sp. TaxID=1936787 RepID=UPI00333F4349